MYTPLTKNFMANKNLVKLNADIPCVVAGHLISSILRYNTNIKYNIIYQIVYDISYHICRLWCTSPCISRPSPCSSNQPEEERTQISTTYIKVLHTMIYIKTMTYLNILYENITYCFFSAYLPLEDITALYLSVV